MKTITRLISNVIGKVFSSYDDGVKFVEEQVPREVDHQSIPSKY